MKRALVLVEGDTEEVFVRQVLQEHFWDIGLHIEPTIAVTRRVKSGADFRGGITSFGKFKKDLSRLLYSGRGAIVTTMIDYYRLPEDFPGMNSRPAGTPLRRVQHVEEAIHRHFGAPRLLIPYLSLHEFEALLFSAPETLAGAIPAPDCSAGLATVRSEFGSPEDINEQPGLSPSKRIRSLIPWYQKSLHGPIAARRIGLAQLRADCAHFNGWISHIESLARELAG